MSLTYFLKITKWPRNTRFYTNASKEDVEVVVYSETSLDPRCCFSYLLHFTKHRAKAFNSFQRFYNAVYTRIQQLQRATTRCNALHGTHKHTHVNDFIHKQTNSNPSVLPFRRLLVHLAFRLPPDGDRYRGKRSYDATLIRSIPNFRQSFILDVISLFPR